LRAGLVNGKTITMINKSKYSAGQVVTMYAGQYITVYGKYNYVCRSRTLSENHFSHKLEILESTKFASIEGYGKKIA